jgi:integrase
MGNLEPLSPKEAVRIYLDARKDNAAASTIDTQTYRLRAFLAWCEEEEIEDLSELDGRDLYAYRVWRREGNYDDASGELKKITLRGDLSTIRAFMRFCGRIEAVPPDLYEKVPLPIVSRSEGVSDSTLEVGRADAILDYLGRYHYASRQHVIMLLLWHTGCRAGALRGLDVRDVDLEGERPNGKGPAVHFVHRPETGTPLKNKDLSTRWNTISTHVGHFLEDYIKDTRLPKTDEFDRQPLITTRKGRIAVTTIRDNVYRVTRPCWRGERCPHDEDPETCEFTKYPKMSMCESSRSPHDVRSGRVTAYRLDDVPRQGVGDRLNASREILDKHYDRRSERQKAEQRRRYLPD